MVSRRKRRPYLVAIAEREAVYELRCRKPRSNFEVFNERGAAEMDAHWMTPIQHSPRSDTNRWIPRASSSGS